MANGKALGGTVTENSYDPGPLDFGQTYYWKVGEVNEARTPSVWEGDIWSFSTSEYFVVDDFESYTNESPNRVFQTWIDGWGSRRTIAPEGNTGNGTGSMVGYDSSLGTIVETVIVHGGKQSMPVEYNNVNRPYYSEAGRTWDEPQDWTGNGADTLVLYFRGNPVGFLETAPGSITMSGVGTDIWNAADQFRFACKCAQRQRHHHRQGGEPCEYRSVGQSRRHDPREPRSGLAVCDCSSTPGNGVHFQARLLNAGAA